MQGEQIMAKSKMMKFKVDKVHCELCKTSFPVNKYIVKSPMDMFSGKPIPKKQLPNHKCKGEK